MNITELYGLGDGWVLYEGCDKVLNDGQPCKLGWKARCDRLRRRPLFVAQNIRDRTGHVCCPIGTGMKMWNFVVVIDNLAIDVFGVPGQDLLGISGKQWAKTYGPNAYLEDIMCQVEDDRWDRTFKDIKMHVSRNNHSSTL